MDGSRGKKRGGYLNSPKKTAGLESVFSQGSGERRHRHYITPGEKKAQLGSIKSDLPFGVWRKTLFEEK